MKLSPIALGSALAFALACTGAPLDTGDTGDTLGPGDSEEDYQPPQGDYWMPDRDRDGYGSNPDGVFAEESPGEEYVLIGGDCDDTDPLVNPETPEVCDGEDEDCDGEADDGLMTAWVLDSDGDGYGSGEVFEGCDPPGNATQLEGDCGPDDPDVYPGAPEVCGNATDDDCDGLESEDDQAPNWTSATALKAGEDDVAAAFTGQFGDGEPTDWFYTIAHDFPDLDLEDHFYFQASLTDVPDGAVLGLTLYRDGAQIGTTTSDASWDLVFYGTTGPADGGTFLVVVEELERGPDACGTYGLRVDNAY